jgi:hypothetical protein
MGAFEVIHDTFILLNYKLNLLISKSFKIEKQKIDLCGLSSGKSIHKPPA